MNFNIGCILFLILLFISSKANAQYPPENPLIYYKDSPEMIKVTLEESLQKYWDYRHSLREDFMISGDGQGSNIPAAIIGVVGNFYMEHAMDNGISFSDGNSQLQYYIGLLATEYALLKRTGQNYDTTRAELLAALNTIERLDLHAESYFREDNSVIYPDAENDNDLNGFMLRDDIDPILFRNKKPQYLKYKNDSNKYFLINSMFHKQLFNRGEPYTGCGGNDEDGEFTNSKDSYWHYLVNLALVKGLVDDAEISTKAMDITYRLISNLHTEGLTMVGGIPHKTTFWVNINPVTGQSSPGGGDIDASQWDFSELQNEICDNFPNWLDIFFAPGFCSLPDDLACTPHMGEPGAWCTGQRWGIAMAGNWITGRLDWDYTYPNLWQEVGEFSKDRIRNRFYKELKDYDEDESNANAKIYSKRAMLTVMGREDEFMERKPDNPDNLSIYEFLVDRRDKEEGWRYEHLPLEYQLLHDATEFNPFDIDEMTQYLNLFSLLQERNEVNNNEWYDPLSPFYKHPVYHMWYSANRLVWPVKPDFTAFGRSFFSHIDFMLLHNLFWLAYIQKNTDEIWDDTPLKLYEALNQPVESYENPGVIFSDNIDIESRILSGSGIKAFASKNVKLLPGFHAEEGTYFKAAIYGPEYKVLEPKRFLSLDSLSWDRPWLQYSYYVSLEEEEDIFDEYSNYKSGNINNTTKHNDYYDITNSIEFVEDANSKISIYPNPSTGQFNLTLISDLSYVQVYNVTGKLLHSEQIDGANSSINLKHLPKGLYFIEINSGITKVKKKIIIQ